MGDEPRRTLAARLEDRDRRRFTGRRSEIAFLDDCLGAADPPASVVHVCGPGGIGKSTLLREVGRRARDRGRTVVALDGRELGPGNSALDDMLRAVTGDDRPVVLLDSYEQMTALDPHLRHELLPALPDASLVVIAGRRAPDPGWFAGGWESVTARLDLAAMAPEEASNLLAAHGVADERVPAIVDWAAGWPLALALAADAANADAGWNATRSPDRPDILRSLLHRLVETELQDIRPSALSIAVVARATTVELLRAVLPDEDAEEAYRQLSGLTVTEPLGNGIMMHELVRKVLLADLRLRNPDLERELRRKTADYLYERAIAGDPLVIIDMAHLVENPLIKWGFGWDGSVGMRIDTVRPGDAEQAQRGPGNGADPVLWPATLRYFTEAPARVAIARDDTDQICGYMVCMSLATAPHFADDDPLMGPWLAHARSNSGLGDSVLWQSAVDFSGEGKVQAMLGIAGVLRSGAVSPRFAYLPLDTRVRGAIEFAQAIGAQHVPELDATFDTMRLQCYRLDYGPGGLFALVRSQIYAELGLPRPASAGALRPPVVDLETVRELLKNFRVPRELARSPLAAGSSVAERAEFVRDLVRRAAAEAFGDSETEKLLHSVLVAGYLEPLRSHEEAASRLCMSRAAYFRRLRTAVERLAEHMAAGSGQR
jgi:AAA ATPase domain